MTQMPWNINMFSNWILKLSVVRDKQFIHNSKISHNLGAATEKDQSAD